MTPDRPKQKVILCFSQVVSTPIYDAIVKIYSEMEIELVCVYFGSETSPVRNFAKSLSLQTVQYNARRKLHLFRAFLKFMTLCRSFSPKVVFCFGQTATLLSFVGSLFTPSAKRVYFRQHTSSNRAGRFSRGAMYDVLSNLLADKVIVSNINTYNYMINDEGLRPEKLAICQFGFDKEYFASPNEVNVSALKNKYELTEADFIVGVVSRISPMKGLEYTFRAFAEFLGLFPNSILILANAMEASPLLLEPLTSMVPKENLRIFDRENDMSTVYGCMDVLIHVPISRTVESYGLVYVEAFLSGIPTIITLSGVANEIAIDHENCLIVDYKNSKDILNALSDLRTDAKLRVRLGSAAAITVGHLTLMEMQLQFKTLLLGLLKA